MFSPIHNANVVAASENQVSAYSRCLRHAGVGCLAHPLEPRSRHVGQYDHGKHLRLRRLAVSCDGEVLPYVSGHCLAQLDESRGRKRGETRDFDGPRGRRSRRRLRIGGTARDPSAVHEDQRAIAQLERRHDEVARLLVEHLVVDVDLARGLELAGRAHAPIEQRIGTVDGTGQHHGRLTDSRLEQALALLLLVAAMRLPHAQVHGERDERGGADGGPARRRKRESERLHGPRPFRR
jgi:hypothetical protein